MTTAQIREKLVEYIREADDKKIKAIYTIMEREIQQDDIWTEEFLQELNKRTSEVESGKTKSYTWQEVTSRARAFAKERQG